MGWVSPTGHTEGDWTNEANAYDGSLTTAATYTEIPGTWTPFLEFTLTDMIKCDSVRFFVNSGFPLGFEVDIDVYYGSAWHDVFEGVVSVMVWVEKDIPDETQDVSKVRIRTRHGSSIHTDYVYEVELYETELAIGSLVDKGLVT